MVLAGKNGVLSQIISHVESLVQFCWPMFFYNNKTHLFGCTISSLFRLMFNTFAFLITAATSSRQQGQRPGQLTGQDFYARKASFQISPSCPFLVIVLLM